MPFKSKAQQRWMFAAKPDMARRWADHTEDFQSLPERVGDNEEKKGFVMNVISQIGRDAATNPYVEKLAADAGMSRELIHHLAGQVQLSPIDFVKVAYANPDEFVLFLKYASGAAPVRDIVRQYAMLKKASPNPGMMRQLLGVVQRNPWKTGLGATGVAGMGATGYMAMRGRGGAAGGGGAAAAQAPTPAAGPTEAALDQTNAAQAAAAPNPAAQGAAAGGEAPAAGGAAPKPGGGMGSAALLAALGLGAGGLGYMAYRNRKKEKQSFDTGFAIRVMRRAIEKKAEEIQKKNARVILNTHLDKVASHMTLEKQAQVRTLQAELSKGRNLSEAIKVAYPQLKGEQRGILATQLVRAAVRDHYKRAEAMCSKTTEPESATVPIAKAGKKLKAMSS